MLKKEPSDATAMKVRKKRDENKGVAHHAPLL